MRFVRAFLLVLKLGPERILALEREAKTDPLTGLLNRRGFLEKLELEKSRSDRYGHQFLVAYLDLDDLKEINDLRGHDEGDRALVALATAIKKSCRQSDFVGRLGGDEFAVVFVEVKGPGDGILRRMSMEAKNASIGFYHYYPSSSSVPVDEMMRLAEGGMREEKKRRKVGR